MTGIEPALSAWEAEVLPLNYIPVAPCRRPASITKAPSSPGRCTTQDARSDVDAAAREFPGAPATASRSAPALCTTRPIPARPRPYTGRVSGPQPGSAANTGARRIPIPLPSTGQIREPRHDLRAVLRPRLRVRLHAGLAPDGRDAQRHRHPAGAHRALAHVVDVGRLQLDLEPGLRRPAVPAHGDDVRDDRGVHRRAHDPRGVRRPRGRLERAARVRRRLRGGAHHPHRPVPGRRARRQGHAAPAGDLHGAR